MMSTRAVRRRGGEKGEKIVEKLEKEKVRAGRSDSKWIRWRIIPPSSPSARCFTPSTPSNQNTSTSSSSPLPQVPKPVRKLNTSSIGRAKVSTILKPLPLPLNFEITPYTPFYGAPTNLEQPLPTWEDNPKYSNVKYRDTVNRELIRVIASREKPCDEIRTVVISKVRAMDDEGTARSSRI